MSWHYSQEQEAEFSVVNYLDGIRLEQLKSKNIPEKYYCKDNGMESLNLSQYGMILQRLMVNHGKGVLISFPGGSLVKTFQQQEKELGLMGNDQDSGEKWQESLTKYDPNSHSWKIAQCSLFGDLEEFSGIFPKWGIMQDGACWELMMPERRIDGKESGYWRTPDSGSKGNVATPTKCVINGTARKDQQVRLVDQVTMVVQKKWATPSARDWKDSPGMSQTGINPDGSERQRTDQLARQVYAGGTEIRQTYPTPTNSMMTFADMEQARTAGNSTNRPKYQDVKYPTPDSSTRGARKNQNGHQITLQDKIGTGQLNPDWVEWLMGWPIGWTDSNPLETDKFQQWQQSHSLFCQRGLYDPKY